MNEENAAWKQILERGSNCPDLQELLGIAGRAQDDASRSVAMAHVETCPSCRGELSLYESFLSAEPGSGEIEDAAWISRRLRERSSQILGDAQAAAGDRELKRIPTSRWTRLFSMPRLPALSLAAAVLLFTVGIFLMTRVSPELDIAPIGSSTPELRSGAIEGLVPSGDQESRPQELRWQAVDRATAYEVEMLEVDGSVFWRARASSSSIVVAPEAREQIVPLKRLLWRVRALDGSGQVLRTSDDVSFRWMPAPKAGEERKE